MQKIVVTSAAIVAVVFASAAARAQAPYPGSATGWGPIAAQAAQAISNAPLAAAPGIGAYAYVPGSAPASGLGAYAYVPGPEPVSGLAALAAAPVVAADVATASWFTRGFGAYAYAPGPLAVANYGLGMNAGAYCARRYRSYDASTGTFLGRDGQRHPCP